MLNASESISLFVVDSSQDATLEYRRCYLLRARTSDCVNVSSYMFVMPVVDRNYSLWNLMLNTGLSAVSEIYEQSSAACGDDGGAKALSQAISPTAEGVFWRLIAGYRTLDRSRHD